MAPSRCAAGWAAGPGGIAGTAEAMLLTAPRESSGEAGPNSLVMRSRIFLAARPLSLIGSSAGITRELMTVAMCDITTLAAISMPALRGGIAAGAVVPGGVGGAGTGGVGGASVSGIAGHFARGRPRRAAVETAVEEPIVRDRGRCGGGLRLAVGAHHRRLL